VKRTGEENRGGGGDDGECFKDVAGSGTVIGENVEQMVTPQSITKMRIKLLPPQCEPPAQEYTKLNEPASKQIMKRVKLCAVQRERTQVREILRKLP
jgi:hypothetical protein